jgi:NADH dehydrogenase
VAVTGAAGLLGRHLCDHLQARGWGVRALMRDPTRYPFAQPGIETARFVAPDVIDVASLRGADAVIHGAYMTRFTSYDDARQVNVEGTTRLLEASRAAGVPRFVFISSTSAHPEAVSFYGRSKYALEQVLDPARDLAIRPGLILATDGGLFSRMVASIRRLGVVPLFGGGRQVIQTVHVEDLSAAIERALAGGFTGRLGIAEREGLTMKAFLRLVASHLGRRVITVPVPAAPVLATLRAFERLGIRLPVSSENLLGLLALRHLPVADDLARLGVSVRTAEASLRSLLPARVSG